MAAVLMASRTPALARIENTTTALDAAEVIVVHWQTCFGESCDLAVKASGAWLSAYTPTPDGRPSSWREDSLVPPVWARALRPATPWRPSSPEYDECLILIEASPYPSTRRHVLASPACSC